MHYLYSFLAVYLFKQNYSEGNPKIQGGSDPWKQSLFFLLLELPLLAPAWKDCLPDPHSVSTEVYPYATSSEKPSLTTLSTNTSSSPHLHLPPPDVTCLFTAYLSYCNTSSMKVGTLSLFIVVLSGPNTAPGTKCTNA